MVAECWGELPLSESIIRKSRFIFTKERITIRQKSGRLNHANERICQVNTVTVPDAGEDQGFLKCLGVRFADFISFILNIP